MTTSSRKTPQKNVCYSQNSDLVLNTANGLGSVYEFKIYLFVLIYKKVSVKRPSHPIKYWYNLIDQTVIRILLISWTYTRIAFQSPCQHQKNSTSSQYSAIRAESNIYSLYADTRTILDKVTVLVSQFNKTLTVLYFPSSSLIRNLQGILRIVGFTFCGPVGSPMSCLIYVASV